MHLLYWLILFSIVQCRLTLLPCNAFRTRKYHIVSHLHSYPYPTRLHSSDKPFLSLTYSEIDALVYERVDCRRTCNYQRADEIKLVLEDNGIILTDYSYKEGGGSTWVTNSERNVIVDIIEDARNTLLLAKTSMGVCTEYPVENAKAYMIEMINDNKVDEKGRHYCDAAFLYALAGVDDNELFQLLAITSLHEILRYGRRSSCSLQDILQQLEKLALAINFQQIFDNSTASLSTDRDYQHYSSELKALLTDKLINSETISSKTYDDVMNDNLSLLSFYPLLNLYRYAASLKKSSRCSSTDDLTHNKCVHLTDIFSSFSNPTLPLYLDLGCGFGVSTIGLASTVDDRLTTDGIDILNGKCNYVGVDLNKDGIRYATAVAKRWELSDRCKHLDMDITHVLKHIINHNLSVECIVVNFPTPYGIELLLNKNSSSSAGNSQLPVLMDNFLLSNEVVSLIATIMKTNQCFFHLQTNVEDVAVYVKDAMCVDDGIAPYESPSIRYINDEGRIKKTERQIRLEEMSVAKRAVGVGYLDGSIMSATARGMTETEVHCIHNNIFVHRLLLKGV